MIYAIHCSNFKEKTQWLRFDTHALVNSNEWVASDRVQCRCIKITKGDFSFLCYVNQAIEDDVILRDNMKSLNIAVLNFFKNQKIDQLIKQGDMLRYYDSGSSKFHIRPIASVDGRLGWEIEYD